MSSKVMITGAGGFLGGTMVTRLVESGATVVAVLHKERNETLASIHKREIQKEELLERIAPGHRERVIFFEGDITHAQDMDRLFQEQRPDALIHAAALLIPPVRPKEIDDDRSYPLEFRAALEMDYRKLDARFIEVNQAKVLANCAANYQKNINPNLYCLLVSTIHVFNPKVTVINEETEHAPPSVYAKTKDAAEQHWESVLNIDKLGVIYPPQIFAPHQFTQAVIPASVENLIHGESGKKPLSGSMNPIHADNLIKLMIALCESSEKGRFCVSGDGVMTLEYIGKALEKAVTDFLKPPTPLPALIISTSQGTPPPIVDDSRIVTFFKRKYPEVDPHQVKSFPTVATDIVVSMWGHLQRVNQRARIRQQLEDCIYEPSQNGTPETFAAKVTDILPLFQSHPVWVLKVLSGHQHISAIHLLSDLAKKMQQQNCIDTLRGLFDTHLDMIIEDCVFNAYDLNRLLVISPAHEAIIMEKTFSNETYIQKIRENSDEPEKTLHAILERYPQYQVQFQKSSAMLSCS